MGLGGKIPDSLSGNWDKDPLQPAPARRLHASHVVGPSTPQSSDFSGDDAHRGLSPYQGDWVPPAVRRLPIGATIRAVRQYLLQHPDARY